MGNLDGLRILVPESRQLNLFVNMIEEQGGTAIRCPLVQILDLEDSRDAEAWIDALIAGGFQDIIWLTGEGLRRLLVIAQRTERETAFIAALGNVRSITRGPKPARALREIGLAPGLAATTPTSGGVAEALAPEDIAGRPIGVQLYPGNGPNALLATLRGRGAVLTPVTPYRYASQAETAQVVWAIEEMAARRIDVIAFTSTPQVERLFDVAEKAGLGGKLKEAFAHVSVASIGPVVEEALHRHGIVQMVQPEAAFHMKPLLRTIAAWNADRAISQIES
ncbi:MAG: uroporphyrinogen-III synthase [Methylovirgula sp.]|uniref:uroporphyrinogen-III synthase n=1 Tax=Methylovirgula sp. TaxID=1978224 RepID=UPI0030762FB6